MSRRLTMLCAVATVLGGLATGGAALARPAQPCVIARIVAVKGAYNQIKVRRGAAVWAASSYEPLCAGDQLTLADGLEATLQFTRRVETVRAAPGGYEVPDEPSGWSWDSFARMLKLFPTILEPPHPPRSDATTPASIRGADLRESPLLPVDVEQQVRARPGALRLPIAWQGDGAAVELRDEGGSLVARAPAGRGPFAVLYAPELRPGRYVARIGGEARGALAIRINVSTAAERASPSDVDETLAAAAALRGPASGRLQGLIDLQRLSDLNFLAFSLTDAISRGEAVWDGAP